MLMFETTTEGLIKQSKRVIRLKRIIMIILR